LVLAGRDPAQLKETDPAIEAFEKALPLTAEKAPVYFNLGLLYMENTEPAKAEEAYGRGSPSIPPTFQPIRTMRTC